MISEHDYPLRLPGVRPLRVPGRRIVWPALALAAWIVFAAVVFGAILLFALHVDVSVPASGHLLPRDEWRVRAREAGVIRHIAVAAGQVVQAGQVLGILDHREASREVERLLSERATLQLDSVRAEHAAVADDLSSKAAIAGAEARVAATRTAALERLVAFGLGAKLDSLLASDATGRNLAADAAVAEVRSADASLRAAVAAQARVDLNRFDIRRYGIRIREVDALITAAHGRGSRLTLVSPIAGMVVDERPELLAGTAVSAGQHILTVVGMVEWNVSLNLSERDVSQIHVSDHVRLEVPSLRGSRAMSIEGRVVHVARAAGTQDVVEGSARATPRDGSGANYRTVVAVNRASLDAELVERLRSGLNVDVRIVVGSKRLIDLIRLNIRGR